MSDISIDPEVARLQTAAQWLVRLGELPEDDVLVAQWLEWCDAAPENLAAFERIQNTWQLAGAAAMAPPVSAGRGMATLPRRRRRMTWLAYAATIVVLMTGVVVAMLMHDRPDNAEVLATPVAIRASSTLPDGSRVELGARSRLSLHYSPAVRRVVIESGEAYFEVAHNTKRPFVVEAGGLQVTAVGTAFNVHRGDERVVVTVSEGRVRLAAEDAPVSIPGGGSAKTGVMPSALEAAAGEQALFSKKTEHIAIAHADPAIATAWRDGVLKFVNQPLSDVVQDLNRYSERPIVLADASLDALPYTGTVFGDRLDDWLHAIEDVFDVRVIEDDSHRIVIEKRKG